MQLQPQYLPIYFGNVCLRFLPVFDIIIHRFLELLPVAKSLETLLDHLGGLYKFHGGWREPGRQETGLLFEALDEIFMCFAQTALSRTCTTRSTTTSGT